MSSAQEWRPRVQAGLTPRVLVRMLLVLRSRASGVQLTTTGQEVEWSTRVAPLEEHIHEAPHRDAALETAMPRAGGRPGAGSARRGQAAIGLEQRLESND